jgi:hypothetical protein
LIGQVSKTTKKVTDASPEVDRAADKPWSASPANGDASSVITSKGRYRVSTRRIFPRGIVAGAHDFDLAAADAIADVRRDRSFGKLQARRDGAGQRSPQLLELRFTEFPGDANFDRNVTIDVMHRTQLIDSHG